MFILFFVDFHVYKILSRSQYGLSTIRIIEAFFRARLMLVAHKTLMRLLLSAVDYLHALVDITTRCAATT